MQEIIWMFPILFIVHDMEEIMGFGLWLKRNKALLDRKYQKISNTYNPYSTEGMTAAVMEELVICLPLSIWFIIVSINILSYSASQVIFYSLIGIIAIAGNLKIAHWIIHIFTKKLVAMEV